MEDIYALCDKIVESRILSLEALEMVLTGISKGGKAKYRYKKTDPFVARAQSMNARAKKRGAHGRVSPKQLCELWGEAPRCKNCGAGLEASLVFDHIVSLYRGGENTVENLQILCSKCNMEKGAN